MSCQGIFDSSEPECSHEGYIAEKHVYCPDCGDAGAEMLLQARIAELESQVTTDNSAVIATLEKRVEELEAENKQLLERESLCDWGWG